MQDNHALRALLCFPAVQSSTSKALTTPQTPTPRHHTGDRELDAVLWLRDCIGTGHSGLIDQALEAFKKIKTSPQDLEKRYGDYLLRTSGNSLTAALGSIDFANLEDLAARVKARQVIKNQALAMFGTVKKLFQETPAESASRAALKGLRRRKNALLSYDHDRADQRFGDQPELAPSTLADCLHALSYEQKLYQLRQASEEYGGDHIPEFQEYADYCFRCLVRIQPRSKAEALSVFDYLEEQDAMDRDETPRILRNLIAGGWA